VFVGRHKSLVKIQQAWTNAALFKWPAPSLAASVSAEKTVVVGGIWPTGKDEDDNRVISH
jgi:hypothetical protein